jgi:cysteinyl-tRNA synthetase
MKFLGEQIDIHGGGQDVVFPHHENEIAQSESFTGKKPFVQHWMHNGLLQMGAEKMSKSLGNLITIRDGLKKYTSDGLRVFILSSYYRSPLTYTEEAIDAAQAGAERLQRVAAKENTGGKGNNLDARPYYDKFIEAMDDDFNTPQAMAALFDLARDINRAEEDGKDAAQARRTLKELGGVLGLTFKAREDTPLDVEPIAEVSKFIIAKMRKEKLEYILEKVTANPDVDNVDGYLNLLRELRNALRKDNPCKTE